MAVQICGNLEGLRELTNINISFYIFIEKRFSKNLCTSVQIGIKMLDFRILIIRCVSLNLSISCTDLKKFCCPRFYQKTKNL